MKEVTFPMLGGWTLSVRGADPNADAMVVKLVRGDEVISRASQLGTKEAASMKALQVDLERAGGRVTTWSPNPVAGVHYDAPDAATVDNAREAIEAHRARENGRPARINPNRKAGAQ